MKNLSEILAEGKKLKSFAKKVITPNLDFSGYYADVPDVNEDGVYMAFSRRKENPPSPTNYSLVYIDR